MIDSRHAYIFVPLFSTGVILGITLIGAHLLALVRPATVQGFLHRFPRNQLWGKILLAIGFAWFWLLIAPPNLGLLSSLQMDFGEFNSVKPVLQWLLPVGVVLISMSVRDFLAVRALGVVGLMVAAPLMAASDFKDPETSVLIPVYAYLMIIASLYFVGMPYLFRDAVVWSTASASRWRNLCLVGLLYGIATLACALLFWKGA